MQEKNINSAIHIVDWPVNDVVAFTTTRLHPFFKRSTSTASSKFGDFNLALHVGDDKESVLANRQCLAQLLPKNKKIQWLEQVHGNSVHHVKEWHAKPVKADASFTTNKNIALAIMTADCLPILLSDQHGNEIAAIHGGWRPLANNIIRNTVSHFSSQPEQINAWLGPCIGKQTFEVGKDVVNKFIALDKSYTTAFQAVNTEKYIGNLHQIAVLQLKALGIAKFYFKADCTYSNTHEYYSFRAEGQTGRMASIICAK